jgi:hypothetical protein
MYYKHSGQFSLVGLAIGTVTGVAAAVPLGYAYGLGLIQISDERMAFLATLSFGALIGAATGYGLIWGKVRNQPVALATNGITSALALYLSWAVWIAAILKNQQADDISWRELASRPADVWHLMGVINQYGTWSNNNGPAVHGLELWGIWLLEAAAVIGAALATGFYVTNRHPFCEACGRWGGRGARFILSAPQDLTQLKLQIEANDFRSMEALGAGNKGGEHLVVVLDTCEGCRSFHTMSITHSAVQRNRFGSASFRHKEIVKHLLVNPAQAETLRQISQKMAMGSKSVKITGALPARRS